MKKILLILMSCVFCCGAVEDAAREGLLKLLAGEWVSRGIYVATKLEIADHLSEPKSIDELAQITNSDPEFLYTLLRLLAGFNVFEEVSPRVFSNTETSQLLIKTHPETLHSLSLFYGDEIHKSWDELLACVKTKTPAFELVYKKPFFTYFREYPEVGSRFHAAMKEKTKAVIQSSIATFDFGKFHSLCDVGGGYGQFMQEILQKYPNLSGAIYELPEVIKKIPESNRCQLIPGDFFVSIPKNYDAYLLKSILHDWDDQKAEKILANCYEAMKPDSRLLVVEIVLLPKDQSIYGNCMNLLVMAILGGKERTVKDFTKMLDRSGFVLEAIHPTATEFSILEIRKAICK